jgi:hypothetical protein
VKHCAAVLFRPDPLRHLGHGAQIGLLFCGRERVSGLPRGEVALRAVATTSSSLRHCSSSVSRLPAGVDAKPHWGLRARFSIGT